jgi:steroid delta-isomerase-like uncharacterized protein
MADHESDVRRGVDAWNAHDWETYVAGYAPDAVTHGMPGVSDNDSLGTLYAAIWQGVPDARMTIDEIVEQGDRVAVRMTMRGTHGGDLFGAPPSGKPVEMPMITMLRFDDRSRVAERWTVADNLALLQQIGALGAPA